MCIKQCDNFLSEKGKKNRCSSFATKTHNGKNLCNCCYNDLKPNTSGKIWCESCEQYSIIEKGTVYVCEICENWHYSSS